MKKPIRRINLYGGPGAAKSTGAAWLFARLKMRHRSVELVQEYVKTWSYENRPPQSFDQVYLLAKQMHKEDIVLRSGVELLVSDSPVFLTTCYARRDDVPGWRHLVALSHEFDEAYAPLDIFLERKGTYSTEGRFEDEGDALRMDDTILEALKDRRDDTGRGFDRISFDDYDAIKKLVLESL